MLTIDNAKKVGELTYRCTRGALVYKTDQFVETKASERHTHVAK